MFPVRLRSPVPYAATKSVPAAGAAPYRHRSCREPQPRLTAHAILGRPSESASPVICAGRKETFRWNIHGLICRARLPLSPVRLAAAAALVFFLLLVPRGGGALAV